MARRETCKGFTLHSPRTALLAASALLAPRGPAALLPPHSPGALGIGQVVICPTTLGCWPGQMPWMRWLLQLAPSSLSDRGLIRNGHVHRTAVMIWLMTTFRTWHSINTGHAEESREAPVSFDMSHHQDLANDNFWLCSTHMYRGDMGTGPDWADRAVGDCQVSATMRPLKCCLAAVPCLEFRPGPP